MELSKFSFVYYEVSREIGALIFSNIGVAGLVLPCIEKEETIREIYKKFSLSVDCEITEFIDDKNSLIRPLLYYFRGQEVKFNYVLDLRGFTEFEKEVYKVVSSIPYGEQRSYKWVAETVGKPGAYRAVGNALAKNPIPIVIPCHRIVASDGGLGGWSGKEGWKRKLLELEGVENQELKV